MFRSVIVYYGLIGLVMAHENHGGSCESSSEARIMAEYRPGTVDLDGRGDDWKDVDGFEFPLRPALDPDEENQYRGGKMTVKVSSFSPFASFLLEVGVVGGWDLGTLFDFFGFYGNYFTKIRFFFAKRCKFFFFLLCGG